MDKIVNGNRRCPTCNRLLSEKGMTLVCVEHGVVDDFHL